MYSIQEYFPHPTRGGDSTDQTSQPNLRNLNFTNTLYQLAYYQVLLVTLAGYCVHSTVVPVIVPKIFFAPSEEIDGKELLLSNAEGCYK